MTILTDRLQQSTGLHRHLCPRQVLGVRMGMYAGELLQLDLPQSDKRLLAFVETDGCFADGVSVATGCHLGRRTMRLIDYGKVAATFVDRLTMTAVRMAPHPLSRQNACDLKPLASSQWHAQLEAYQELPYDRLLTAQFVQVSLDVQALMSQPGVRTNCEICGEEIINEREVLVDGHILCRSCADSAYYVRVNTNSP